MRFILFLGLAAAAFAQEGPHPWRLATEVDVLPFATGGYYGSLVAARGEWRLRGVAARSTVPQLLVSDGFQDKRVDAYAVLADRFLGSRKLRQEGLWIGGGAEWWRSRVRTSDTSGYANFNNAVLTAGGGYVWRFSRHFYLNPWAGGHFIVGGSRQIPVSGKMYQQSWFTPEVSVKFGFSF